MEKGDITTLGKTRVKVYNSSTVYTSMTFLEEMAVGVSHKSPKVLQMA